MSAHALVVEIRSHPGEYPLLVALGAAYAGLGRTDEAVRALQEGETLYPLSHDAYSGAHLLSYIAGSYAKVGEDDAALDRVERLLSVPSPLSVPLLRLDPKWDPLRDHPRFQTLMTQFE